jgi:1-aminocyclopropane-1-carboxylate deaminase
MTARLHAEPDTLLQERALAVPLERLSWALADRCGLEVLVRRDDTIDPLISGNKFYKLFYNLQEARARGESRLISFGGAWSNHLHALAAAGHRYGFETLGVVRGERPANLSATLRDAEAWGMRLHFLGRVDYARKSDSELVATLQRQLGAGYWIPEGGANEAGCRGATEIGVALQQQLQGDYQQVCVAVGTGSTLAGIAAGLPADKRVVGFSVLKGGGSLGPEIARAVQQSAIGLCARWSLISGYHGGGYGRRLPPAILEFWQEFERETGLLLDPVYTLKMFWGVAQLMQQGYWSRGNRLVAIHTGGLQGRRGFVKQLTWSEQ